MNLGWPSEIGAQNAIFAAREAAASRRGMKPSWPVSSVQTSRPLRVLLIQQDPAVDQFELESFATSALAQSVQAAFDVASVGRLEEGLRHLSTGDVDAVLLDLGLPEGDGLDALLRVRLRAPGVPVVVVTGRRIQESPKRCCATARWTMWSRERWKGPPSRAYCAMPLRAVIKRTNASAPPTGAWRATTLTVSPAGSKPKRPACTASPTPPSR